MTGHSCHFCTIWFENFNCMFLLSCLNLRGQWLCNDKAFLSWCVSFFILVGFWWGFFWFQYICRERAFVRSVEKLNQACKPVRIASISEWHFSKSLTFEQYWFQVVPWLLVLCWALVAFWWWYWVFLCISNKVTGQHQYISNSYCLLYCSVCWNMIWMSLSYLYPKEE